MTTEVQADAERLRDMGAWVKIDAMRDANGHTVECVEWPRAKRPATLPPEGEGFDNWCEGLNDAVFNAPSAAASPLYCDGYAAGLRYLQAQHYVQSIDALIEGV